MTVQTLRVYPGRDLPEVYFLAGSPAEAIARAFIASRHAVPVGAQGGGIQPAVTVPPCVSSLDCGAGAGSPSPAPTFSGWVRP